MRRRRPYVARSASLPERLSFFAIKPSAARDACWGWKAYVDKAGYPRMRWGGICQQATRLAYAALLGPIPKGFCVRQRCLNRACTNPRHLFVSSITAKNRDREIMGLGKAGGRKRGGERHPNAKLSDRIVRVILRDQRRTTAEIARRYGVDHSTIAAIRKRKNWKHVEVSL